MAPLGKAVTHKVRHAYAPGAYKIYIRLHFCSLFIPDSFYFFIMSRAICAMRTSLSVCASFLASFPICSRA